MAWGHQGPRHRYRFGCLVQLTFQRRESGLGRHRSVDRSGRDPGSSSLQRVPGSSSRGRGFHPS